MKSQSNKVQSVCDVKIYPDKGSLALRFPLRHNAFWEALDGKSLKGKPKCLGIGKYGFSADEPDDWKRATQIAIAMEADLDHPEWEKLFDRTLAKYGLGGGKYAKLAEIIQMPGAIAILPEITVGAMWESYLEWKKERLEPTTFKLSYETAFTNAIKGLIWDNQRREHTLSPCGTIWDTSISAVNIEVFEQLEISGTTKRKSLAALSEAFARLQKMGQTKLTTNPFVSGSNNIAGTTDKYKSTISAKGEILEWWQTDATEFSGEDSDRRAFTKDERDAIIKAFYGSKRPAIHQAAPLIEFLFLTGCRTGEAFALRWQDVLIGRDKNYIRFSKSYNGRLKNTQVTKTGEVRLFKIYSRLMELLLAIMPAHPKPTDLIFCNTKGVSYNSSNLDANWRASRGRTNGVIYTYPGIVSQLVDEGIISCYLSPYHTRHTFITLQAQAGVDLLLLATACGNSVEVIQRHYLGVNTDVSLADI